MDQEHLDSLIIDFIDNKLNSVDKQKIEKELWSNPQAFKRYEELKELLKLMDRSARLEPSEKLKMNFRAMLNEEIAAEEKRKTIWFRPTIYKVAAAVTLLVLGAGIGFFISNQNDQRLALIEAQMKAQEAQLAITQELLAKLNNPQSASQRMQGIKVVYKMAETNDEVVDVLVKTMNEDPSSNVRIAALEALSHFIEEDQVKRALLKSLNQQKDPVVQISLIQLLVKIKEKSVVNDLQKMVDDEGTMQAVKDAAYSGIMKLS